MATRARGISRKDKAKEASEFNAKPYVKDGASEEEIIQMKECFDIFDSDKSGYIDLAELRLAIQNLGMESNAQKITQILDDYDSNKDSQVSFPEFLEILGFYKKDLKDEENIKQLFKAFDSGNGMVSVDDFRRVAQEIGERYSEEELKDMVEYSDIDKDGFLNYQEFKAVLQKDFKD